MSATPHVIGIDYGSDSCRAVIVNAATGNIVSSEVFEYPRWKKGLFCDSAKSQFRQHPLDYIEGLEFVVRGALNKAPESTAESIAGISIDTTGSTPVAVTKNGIPLALTDEFSDDPDAMFVLWKDHTAIMEADEINSFSRTWGGIDYTKFEGGVYSSEWFWAKILHILRGNTAVRNAAYSWVEHCDWMPALLTGCTKPEDMVRSRCAAGHKAMWHEDFDGLPSDTYLTGIDPLLSGLRDKLFTDTAASDVSVGNLTDEWSSRLGLPVAVIVTAGAFDAHMGAVGGQISPGSLLKVMGTSTCDMIVSPPDKFKDTLVPGICGQVNGSIVPGMIGLEAGQSAFGDLFSWFKQLLVWPLRNIEDQQLRKSLTAPILKDLDDEAAKLSPDESGVLALDWLNGRRTPDADQTLKGAIMGLTLGSDAPRVYRSLVDAAAYGARRITERFEESGVEIKDVIAVGGVAKKSPYVMQTVCDVMNKPIRVASELQTVALGAAIFAATAAGIYSSVEEAQKSMGSGFEKTYIPNPEATAVYDELYKNYLEFGAFVEKKTRG
ncbi:MAG: ribulokinase [Bacteroidetes bacterium]|nr:ribulokinase [Bacteroidota bacterium]